MPLEISTLIFFQKIISLIHDGAILRSVTSLTRRFQCPFVRSTHRNEPRPIPTTRNVQFHSTANGAAACSAHLEMTLAERTPTRSTTGDGPRPVSTSRNGPWWNGPKSVPPPGTGSGVFHTPGTFRRAALKSAPNRDPCFRVDAPSQYLLRPP